MAVEDSERYDRTTVALHWITAMSVVALWIIGQTADWFPNHGAVNTGLWSVHVVWGFALGAILAWRILWRSTGGRKLPGAGSGALPTIAKATHHALYGLLLIIIVLGVVNAFVRGYTLFDLGSLPQIGDRELRRPITHWHGFAANILLTLAGLHALAALVHHFLWRDGVLRRMMPGTVGDEASAPGLDR